MKTSTKSYEVETTVGITVTVLAEDMAEAKQLAYELITAETPDDLIVSYIDIDSVELV